MGQYHRIVNVDRMEALSPHPLGNGFKLLEFGCSGYGAMAALGLFLLGEGRWAGNRVAVVGDYHEPGDVPDGLRARGIEAVDLWITRQELGGLADLHAAGCSPDPGRHPLDVSDRAVAALVAAGMWTGEPIEGRGWVDAPVADDYRAPDAPPSWVVNLDRHEALDPGDLGDSPNPYSFVVDYGGGTMTALAVLLAASNGRGGGDLHIDDPLVGSWAFDRLGIVPRQVGTGFTPVSPRVRDILDATGEGAYGRDPAGHVVRYRWGNDPTVPEGTGTPQPAGR